MRENLEYGKKGASQEEIRSAIVLENATTFIDTLPKCMLNSCLFIYSDATASVSKISHQ
jgi:ABC-type multidrug transport system fused ATPase/permease subunit